MRTLKLKRFQINDDILGQCKIRATFAFPTFEDKGRLQARGNGIEICSLPEQSLSREQERDRHLTEDKARFQHSQLGLFSYWIGRNYPIP